MVHAGRSFWPRERDFAVPRVTSDVISVVRCRIESWGLPASCGEPLISAVFLRQQRRDRPAAYGYLALKAGKLAAVKTGKRTFIRRSAWLSLIANLPAHAPSTKVPGRRCRRDRARTITVSYVNSASALDSFGASIAIDAAMWTSGRNRFRCSCMCFSNAG
jgi:hypothetical protein